MSAPKRITVAKPALRTGCAIVRPGSCVIPIVVIVLSAKMPAFFARFAKIICRALPVCRQMAVDRVRKFLTEPRKGFAPSVTRVPVTI
ncbi:MAG: hypothetical protein ACXU9Z_01900 [Gemmatimonadaceae bacterium]